MNSGGMIIESYKLVAAADMDHRVSLQDRIVSGGGQRPERQVAGRVPRSGLQKALAGFFGQN